MAIPKGNGKIRPVAMVSGLGKLVGKVVNTILGKHGLLDQLRFQFLGCRDGSCRLVHAVRTAFEEGEIRTVVVALDMANAYNSVSRRAMIEEVRRLDEKLVPAVLALYGSSSPLLFATDEGEVFELKSNRGVRQGDPAAGALFAIAVHPLVDEVRRAFPDVLILQMADDTTLVGPRRSAFKAAQMLAERLSTVGLRMNTSKTQVLCKRGQREETKARIQRVMKRSRDDPGSPPSVLEGCHLTERSVAVLQCPVGEDLSPEVALEHSMKRLEKEFGPAAERLLAGIEVCGLKRAHHLLLSVVGQKFSYLHRAAGAAAGQELAVFHAALLANLSAVAHKTELDAIGHALSDEMCTVTEDGFREAMSKAIEALVRGLPDEHARREAWWALLGREADGVTRLASAASNPALKKGGYAQMRLAKMLSKGCKAGGMGLPGVAQFRFEATAGFIEAVRDMRKGRFEMAPPPEEALDGPGTGGGEAASGSGAGAGPANAGEAEAEDESGAAAAAAGGTPWVDHPAVGESESKEDCEEGPAHGQQLAGTLDGWLVSGTGGAAEPGHQPTPTSGGQTVGGGAAAASAAGAATEMTTSGGGAAAASAAGAPTGQETSDAAQPRADAAQVYSVRRTPAIGLARDGPDADADGNDPNWKGISLKKLVMRALKRSDRSDATKEVGDILLRCEEVAKGAYRDYERDSKEYKDACTEARYFRPDKDCVVGKEADLHAARVKKRYQLAHVWRSDIAGAVEGLEELRAEIEELALEAMMELRSDDESSDDMEATANLVEEFIRACKGARCLAAATGFEGFLPDTLGKLPGELKAKLRKCLYGDGVTARANEQTEAPWQRKMVLHHDDMLRIKHECVFLRRLAKARRACTARCRAEALAKGTPEKRVANIDDPAMLRVMSDLVAFREACVPGTHYWLRNTMMGPRGLTDEEFAVVTRYRIGASEADHVVPDGVSINCACVQRDTTARGTVHIGGVSGVAHHLARCRCGKGSTIRAHNDVRDVLHAAITSAVSKSYVTQGLQNMDAFLERRENDKMREYKKSSATKDNLSSIVPFVITTTGRMGPAAFAFLKKVADTAFGDRPRERARWAFRWLSRLNEVIAKGLATQLIGQTQYLRQQVERMRKEYKDACTEARYFRPDKDCVVGKEADLHAARVKKRYQLAHVWRSDIARIVKGLEELRDEIEELALEAMMELGSDDESSDDMEAAANLVEEFIRACKGARCLAAATGFEGFLPDTLGKLPGELKAKLRKCLYGDGVTARANEQTEAPWQRKMVLHHDDMLRIKHECVFLRRLAKARRACTARCRAEALAKGTPEKRVANIDDPAMLRVMSDLVAFREACVPGTHYWLRNTMMGPRGLTDEEFAVVTRYRIGASEADHVVPDGVSINCACVQRDTTARGTVHIGGISGITSAVSKSYVTQGLQSMDAFLERRENDKMREYKKSSATKDNLSSIVPFVITTTGRMGPAAFAFLKKPRADAAQVYSVRRTPAIGLARDGPDADADGNDPNWKGISLKKLVMRALKRSDRSDATKEVGDILLRCEEVAKGAYRDYERDSKEYKDACTEARYFRPDKDCVVGKEADLHAARVKKRYQLAHVWRSDIAGAVEGLEELRAEIEELALEAMMELGSDDESSDDMEATANLVEEFIRACKGARCLAAATGFEGFLPDTLGKLPGELKAKLRKCLYGDGVTARANEQTEAPWQRKMVLHHDDMLRIKHECVFLRRLAKARRACTARCRAEALAKGTPEKRVANIDDPAMLRVMSDLVAFREACVPGTHYWLRNTMMGPRGLTDEEFAVVTRYRIGASEADHVVPDGVSINCACVQRDTTARGTVHIGGVSGVAHHLARCRCGKGSTIRAHNDVRDVLHAAITSAVSKSYVTQGLQNMDAFLERRENDKMREYKKSSATKDNLSSIVPFVITTTGRMGPAAFAFLKKVADTAFGDRPRERARWAFRWLSRLNEVIAKGLATQLIGQTQYLRQQVERMR
ncbi:hypothetical protein FNF28_06298 [Cafeteria roenbergensis]|uniref:Reverse transcriptase domain-containing protein n=1 Tax=Cafeteria roenbergensis TaxID=33653 RepID=A0A5A8D1P1_CAFRO|nr:hypothetical protein FNF28_06298 [Cafeteria roenbergensis]